MFGPENAQSLVGLALVAFIAAQWVNRQQPGTSTSLAPTPMGAQDRPAGLPQRAPDDSGIILEIEDNRLLIGSGQSILASTDAEGKPIHTIENATPPVEVVLTKDTRVFRDTTYDDPTAKDGAPQTIAAFDASDLQANNIVFVWGTRRGDRLVAETILYNGGAPARR